MKRKILTLLLSVIAILAMTTFWVGCGKTTLDAPQNITYDGATIKWDAVEGAGKYTLKIGEGNEYTITTNSYAYANSSGQPFNVTVKAVSNKKKVKASSGTTASFTPLNKVTNITVDENGVASWEPVENATAYMVRIDGSQATEQTVTTTSFSGMPVGLHSLQVKAIVEGNSAYYSVYSTGKSINILGTVAKDDIKYENGEIKWKGVAGAHHYEVSVNGMAVSDNNVPTSYEYDAENENFFVTVRAMGNGTNTFNGAVSEEKNFIFLDTVSNIDVESGTLKWEAVAEATSYDVKIGNKTYNVKDTQYSGLEANKNLEIQILPKNEDTTYFSDWSAVKSVFILIAPTIQWNSDYALDGDANNNLYWDTVANANGYAVRVTTPDGSVEEKVFGVTQRNFAEAYLETGTYTVEVKSLADTTSTTVYDSEYSAPLKVKRLAAPVATAQNHIVSDASKVSGGFTVNFEKVSGASGYKLYKDNVLVKSGTTNQFVDGDVVANNVVDEQNYNYTVQSVGSVNMSKMEVVLDSLTANSLSFNIRVLATPSDATMSGFIYSYGAISGNNGYVIDVQGQSYSSGNTQYDLSLLEAGSYSVSVCAKGNGSNVLASNYCAPTTVSRLSAPTNVRIDTTEASEGILKFEEVDNARGYYIVFNNDGNAIPVTEMMNINSYITYEGTAVHMQSSANYYNDLGTVYYMTSKAGPTSNFIKFKAPTFGDVAFSDTQLIWNAPANINTQIYTPTYEVYYPNGTLYDGEKNGTTMNISYLEGGKEYTFQVKAVGNGTNYINSEKSTSVTIWKLAKPEVTRENGKYVWNDVPRATNYVVYVDGEVVATYPNEVGKKFEYTPNFTELKEYDVSVVAMGDEGYTTINSDAFTIIQETKQLTTPDCSVSYSADRYAEQGTIDVTITLESNYARGYMYSIGGTSHESTETSYSLIPNSVGTVEVRVYALGGNFDEEGIYYLDSQNSGTKSIKLLAKPDEASISLNAGGFLRWTVISDAIKYELTLIVDGVEIEEPLLLTTASCNLSEIIENYSTVSTVKVKICAVGNGTNIISSQYTEKEWNNLH